MRLIDADELKEAMEEHTDYKGYLVCDPEEVIDLAPTVERPQWIPCSERLPEESGQYYVSGGDKVWICSFLIIPTFKGGWCNNVSNPVVEAWMPLPTPYQKEGDR